MNESKCRSSNYEIRNKVSGKAAKNAISGFKVIEGCSI